MELEGVFENRPMGACYAVTRHLQSIMAGSNVDPIWDKCMQKQNYKEEIVTDQDGCKTSMLGYCFPVQAAMDHLACFQKLKPTPSRVGYKSLILFFSGDVIVAFGPITLEFWMVEACVDDAHIVSEDFQEIKILQHFHRPLK
jgi:hypothetical protein